MWGGGREGGGAEQEEYFMHAHASVLLPSKAPCGLEHETLRETGILLIWLDATEPFTGEKLCIFGSALSRISQFCVGRASGKSARAELFRRLSLARQADRLGAALGKQCQKNNAVRCASPPAPRPSKPTSPTLGRAGSLGLLSHPSGSLESAARSFTQGHITMTKSLPRLE